MNDWFHFNFRRLRAELRLRFTGNLWKRLRWLKPKTIIDVGVAHGTYELYALFPDADYLLIDPTPQALPYMRRIEQFVRARSYALALGDTDDTLPLDVRDDFQGSTLFNEADPQHRVRLHDVEVRRLDGIVGLLARPVLVKIDVQGAEMMVLRGMTGMLARTDALLIEVSLLSTLKGAPEFAEVVAFLKDHGFVVYDILELKRRPLDGATTQADVLFIREDDERRSDRRWMRHR